MIESTDGDLRPSDGLAEEAAGVAMEKQLARARDLNRQQRELIQAAIDRMTKRWQARSSPQESFLAVRHILE